MMRDRRDHARPIRQTPRLALVLVALIAAGAVLVAALYPGTAPKVTVQSKLKGIGRRTPVQIRIDDPQRVSQVLVEVVQGVDVQKVADQSFEPRPVWRLGSVPAQEMTVEVGRETVQGLRSGTAKVRVTAERAGSWLRRPAPVVAEIELPVRLAPPTLEVQSSFHY
ncbi:MAG TPA: hypothetical protein DD490_01090, partial [Acidobacteria bacterium]|nr:hypothetical protein [Acidobacteriota bacterium]